MNLSSGSWISRGFTLIELLVVIAIIGLLASIVLAQLSNARNKGKDTAIKGEMHNVRTAAAEQFFLLYGHYGTQGAQGGGAVSCTAANPNGSTMWTEATTGMTTLVTDIASKVGGLASMDCGTSASAWSMAVILPSGAIWCVDWNGKARGANTGNVIYTALSGSASAAHTLAGATSCN